MMSSENETTTKGRKSIWTHFVESHIVMIYNSVPAKIFEYYPTGDSCCVSSNNDTSIKSNSGNT